MTFRGGTTATGFNGVVVLSGTSKAWRIDHIGFDNPSAKAIRITGDTYGVIDHNIFDLGTVEGAIQVWHESWNGAQYGDGSFADSPYFGTEKAVYIEDNVITQPSVSKVSIDSWKGGRFVFRYNTVNHSLIGNHGTEAGGRTRGIRTFEIYENRFTYSPGLNWTGINLRGGTGVIFNNTFDGHNSTVLIQNNRSYKLFSPWGQCDGASLYDLNDLNVSRMTGLLQENRDYFNNTPMPGYTPYVYPHPLTLDTIPPSIPTNLAASSMTSSSLSLSWSASTDNVAVTGYKVFRGLTQIATVTSGISYADTGLAPSTTYPYTVSAFDAAGNVSAPSTAVSATTLMVAPALPVITSPSTASGTQGLTVTVLNNTATVTPVPVSTPSPSSGGGGGGGAYTPSDTTPPAQVHGVKIGKADSQVSLSWNNPSDEETPLPQDGVS